MSWLASIAIALLTAAVGLMLGGYLASLAVGWYRVSSFEGGAGYFVVGLALGFSAIVVPRWGRSWFTLSLGIVIGVMMLTYVTVPARIVGIRPAGSRRDKLTAGLMRVRCNAIDRDFLRHGHRSGIVGRGGF